MYVDALVFIQYIDGQSLGNVLTRFKRVLYKIRQSLKKSVSFDFDDTHSTETE